MSLLGWLILIVSSISANKHDVSLEDITGDHITIHMVTHTHDDPGWLITVDQYYVQEVEWIFYTMIPVLINDPRRKFTYVEMAYLNRWWNEIGDKLKEDTKKLVTNGQLQMNLGGWCMNDEASPTAEAVIHQMTDGNQFILNNFGKNGLPTVGWHIDPMGHSWVTAGLFAQGGFDAFGLHRINYMDLEERKNNKDLEFIWKGSNSLGEDSYIFCYILDTDYCSPKYIQFYNSNAFITDDPLLPSWPPNQYQIAETLISDSRQRNSWYRHNQLLMPYGCDFAHQNSYQSMIQMDKLIKYINSNSTYNATIIYSSLSDYIKSVNNLNLTWNVEQPDFFTYVKSPHKWFSGFYTSRPLLKLYTRSRANELRVAEQFYLYAKNMKLNIDFSMGMYNITYLRDAFDILQHHDAITGTEKQDVYIEYMAQLSNGTQRVSDWDESVVGYFLRGPAPHYAIPILKRGNDISLLTNNNFIVLVAYNSLPWIITEFLQIASNRSDLIVYNSKGNIIKSQINPICDGEENSKYPAAFNLFILAENMAPLSFETFFISINSSQAIIGQTYHPKKGETFTAGNEYYTITINGSTNRLSSITNNGLQKTFAVENQFLQYIPSGGKYDDGWFISSPYVFRPATDNRLKIPKKNNNNNLYFGPYTLRQSLQSNSNPGFIIQTHSEQTLLPYMNTYSATICNINLSNNSFTFQFYRADGYNYNEKPIFDYFIFDNNNASYGLLVDGQITGSIRVEPPISNSYTSLQLQFNNNFVNIPVLLTSVRSIKCDGSHYTVTIISITKNNATIYIRRMDKPNSIWTAPVYVDYIAYDSNKLISSPTMIGGEINITIPYGSNSTIQYNISYQSKFANKFIVNEPIILMGIKQILPNTQNPNDIYYYSTTTFASNYTNFMLNIYPIKQLNKKVKLQILYIAFERITLKSPVTDDKNIKNILITGPLMDEVQQTFRNGYSQTFRVFNINNQNDLKYIDNRIHIGPIDQSAEFVTRFTTEFSTKNHTMYTNQAGLEYIERRYNPYIDERIAGNFYPSSGVSLMKNNMENIVFSTIVNQGHGVGSIIDGEYELMLQRRLIAECMELDEALNTTSHTEPQVIILLDNNENTANFNRRYYQIQQFKHSFFFGLTDSISSWISMYNTSWSAINPLHSNGLPYQIFLQQLRYGYSGNNNNSGIILQLQNMFEKGESSLATNVSIDLRNIFNPKIMNINITTEMNLFATIPLREMHRLPWNVKNHKNLNGYITIRDEKSENKRRLLQKDKDKNPIINMAPRDIKTWIVNSVPI